MPKPLSVTELTQKISASLESQFSEIWVEGELSNFHAHRSGHYYFTLKDAQSQIAAVMFRGANRLLKFQPQDGQALWLRGHLSVYAPRGNYQLIVESMEPVGIGALQLAFLQLRERLAAEGLFAPERKKPLPFLPRRIGLVTSPGGAAVRDMIQILRRRHPRVSILLRPTNVQGEAAADEIAQAIAEMNAHGGVDLIIVGRGGGSLEDLWAFNTELVARAIAASILPVISAVGHETDVTIADYVADLRAPTPSAAAELAVPLLEDLLELLRGQNRKLEHWIRHHFGYAVQQHKFWASQLKSPKRLIEERRLSVDDLSSRLTTAVEKLHRESRNRYQLGAQRLMGLSPLGTLERGYALVQRGDAQGALVRSSEEVAVGDNIWIRLHEGELGARVTSQR